MTHSIAVFDNGAKWFQYYSRPEAWRAVAAHVAALPSSSTPERHTARVYEAGLKYFTDWAEDALPDEALLTEFIAHLRGKGLKSTTIGSKYLAPVRLYLKKLSRQYIGATGVEREYVEDIRLRIRAAAEDVKTPPPTTNTNEPALDAVGVRLTQGQLENVFFSINRDTLKGKRDIALLYLGFTSGLRVAELCRLTLANFQPFQDLYLVRVRGKRGSMSPVPVDDIAYQTILQWVEEWNSGLDEADPRRIGENTPIFQPLVHGDHRPQIGANRYNPCKPLSSQGLRSLVATRVYEAIKVKISPHDMRRTVAALLRDAGVDMSAIQQLLRHASIATTDKYCGKPRSYGVSLLSRRISFASMG